jgi:hypothetical protein
METVWGGVIVRRNWGEKRKYQVDGRLKMVEKMVNHGWCLTCPQEECHNI